MNDSLEVAMWEWRERFLGSDDIGDDAFGRLIDQAAAEREEWAGYRANGDAEIDRLTRANETLREFVARAVVAVHRAHSRDGVYAQSHYWQTCSHPFCAQARSLL